MDDTNQLLAAFRSGCRERRDDAPDDALAPLLEHVVATAKAAWPDLEVAREDLARHLGARVPHDVAFVDALLTTRAADLALAFACASEAPGALQAFEATLGSEVRIAFTRVPTSGVEFDDFRQACHEKLFAAGRKIAEYSGQGDLRHWLRVTYVRTLIDLARSKKHVDVPVPEARIAEVPDAGHDPELRYLKEHYKDEFRRAFEEAAADLEAEDRHILRAHVLQHLTVDDVGRMLGVHRATAARRIARARDDLLSGTRRRLMAKLRLSRDELDSVLRLIESNVEMSLSRVLATG